MIGSSMQAGTGSPTFDGPRRGFRIGGIPWSLRLLLAVALAATFAFGSMVFVELRSDVQPQPPTFLSRISLRGADGGFKALTTNRGDRPGQASCTVEAFDVYGRTIGAKVFDLGRLAPAEPLEWRGHLRVEARVERMSVACR